MKVAACSLCDRTIWLEEDDYDWIFLKGKMIFTCGGCRDLEDPPEEKEAS